MTPAPPDPTRHPRDRLVRELTRTDATLLVVSSVIGVGIFLTPGVVAQAIPDVRLFLFAWLLGGVLSLAGALANAELGTMFPQAGGDYVYIREAYHPTAAFLVGWLSFFAIYAGTIATLALGFAEGLAQFVTLSEGAKVTAAVAITALTSWVNYRGLRLGATVNNLGALMKIATLAALAVFGWLVTPSSIDVAAPAPAALPAVTLAGFGLGLSPVLFSYLGWNASVYVASEIRDPERDLPASLFIGLALCTALYLVINALYVHALPLATLAAQPRAGEAAALALFGPLGSSIIGGLILISILGCLHATILVGPRIAYAMALDGLFFAGVGNVHDTLHTPHVAIVVQAVVASALILLLRGFPSLLDYTTFGIVLAAMATTSALYVLRRRRPDHPRPYRAWGYPLVPAFYLLTNAAVAAALMWGRPRECAVAIGVVASGLPFLRLFRKQIERAA